jgi:hypothetical protein
MLSAVLERVVHAAFPRRRLVETQPLVDGLRNANFKVRLDTGPEAFVVRMYEHDPSLCQKEVDLNRLMRTSVPFPRSSMRNRADANIFPPSRSCASSKGSPFAI